MDASRPIPIPLKHRWRLVRLQWLPIIMFALSSAAVVILMNNRAGVPFATGQVNADLFAATSGTEGLLVESGLDPIEPFQRVRAGQVVARLDDRPVRAALAVLQAESGRLRLEVAAARAAWEQANGRLIVDSQSEWHRRMLQVELLRLDVLDRQTQLELDRVSLQHENTRLAQAEAAHLGEAVNSLELSGIRVIRDVIKERIARNTVAISESQAQLKAARDRLSQYDQPADDDLVVVVAPLQAAVTTQEARIEEVRIRIESLVVLAPMDGIVTEVLHVPGQTVAAGEPIVSIAGEQGQYIVAYLRQNQRVQPRVGMTVSVRMRSKPNLKFDSIVDRVGGSYEAIPAEQLRDPVRPEWGLPIRIAIRPDAGLVPGELVDLYFDVDSGT